MSPRLQIQLALVLVLGAATQLIVPPAAEARSALLCPTNVAVSSCNDIPWDLQEQCTGCGRGVICTGSVAGCEFDQ